MIFELDKFPYLSEKQTRHFSCPFPNATAHSTLWRKAESGVEPLIDDGQCRRALETPDRYADSLERIIAETLSQSDYQDWLHSYAAPYLELMAYYRCAMMEVETKFRVLSEERSLQYDHSPIETIRTRLKRPESIIRKMNKRGAALTPESIENTLNDVAGVRVICSFITDIDLLADAFLRQDDLRLLERKDYIRNPKPNGYRSLHLIVETPIFLHDQKRMMKVEVQLRTTAMDWWASAEHKIRYKKDLDPELLRQIDQELLEGARIGAELDEKMALIHRKVTAPCIGGKADDGKGGKTI